METNAHTPIDAALLDNPRVRRAFDTVRTGVLVYGVLGTAALMAVIAVSSSGHLVNAFMWVRARSSALRAAFPKSREGENG
ncbi:hypothetical protein [Streptomyces sp. NPDC054838]